jgi:hypothetical protein
LYPALRSEKKEARQGRASAGTKVNLLTPGCASEAENHSGGHPEVVLSNIVTGHEVITAGDDSHVL